MDNNRAVGFAYEQIAGKYLEEKGYRILEYNFYCCMGEIDIVAKQEDYLVFVEVKYRRNANSGHPLDAVSHAKQRRICQCARYYMHRKGLHDMPARFDVIGILGDHVELIQNAFEYIG